MGTGEPERSSEFLTGHATVSEAAQLLPIDPITVHPDAPLRQLAQRIVERPEVNTIAVVEERGRLLGIIPLALLVDDLFLQVAPEAFLRHALDREALVDALRIHSARTAGELMQPPVAVALRDTIREAFKRLREHHLAGLPIVNEEGRVVGYLDLAQLLVVWLRATQQHLS